MMHMTMCVFLQSPEIIKAKPFVSRYLKISKKNKNKHTHTYKGIKTNFLDKLKNDS